MNKTWMLALLTAVFCQTALAKTYYLEHGKYPVKKSGTMIIRKYAKDDYAVVVARNSKSKLWSGAFGFVKKEDKSSARTASRLTYDTFAHKIDYSSKFVANQPFLYSPMQKAQLFVVSDNTINLHRLNRAHYSQKNKSLSTKKKRRKLKRFKAVPLENLIEAAECVRAMQYPSQSHHGCYYVATHRPSSHKVKSKKPNRPVHLDRDYVLVLAHEYLSFKAIVQQMTHG